MERIFQLPPTTYIGGDRAALPLREIIERLEVRVQYLFKAILTEGSVVAHGN